MERFRFLAPNDGNNLDVSSVMCKNEEEKIKFEVLGRFVEDYGAFLKWLEVGGCLKGLNNIFLEIFEFFKCRKTFRIVNKSHFEVLDADISSPTTSPTPSPKDRSPHQNKITINIIKISSISNWKWDGWGCWNESEIKIRKKIFHVSYVRDRCYIFQG